MPNEIYLDFIFFIVHIDFLIFVGRDDIQFAHVLFRIVQFFLPIGLQLTIRRIQLQVTQRMRRFKHIDQENRDSFSFATYPGVDVIQMDESTL